MKKKKLLRNFYNRPTLKVAKELLGKYIVRKLEGKPRRKTIFLRGKIIETEAYIGPKDKASHAYQGKITPRNQAEYFIGGHIYIYLVYGMYWQMNITTSEAGKPECVLIRALAPTPNFGVGVADGPGKVCRYLKLDKSFYGEDLTKSKRIWLEDPAPRRVQGKWQWSRVPDSKIKRTGRIGIDYAGPYWSKRKWRFVLS